MSQIAHTPAEPVEIEPRRMSPARRARILAHHDGHCAYPDCAETQGLQLDHVIALALGGKDDDANMEPLCELHHKAKTARDLGLIARAKRRALKHTGQFPKAKQPLRSRGFQRRWEP